MNETLQICQEVKTPNGDGIILGRLNEPDGSTRILVSHDPLETIPPKRLRHRRGIPPILYAYRPEDVNPR